MFKTIPIIVMAVLCLNFSGKAQSQKTLPLPTKQAILGEIISATTGEALTGAVLKVTTVNHTVVSTNKGEFILTLSNGAYNLSVSHIGYKTKNLNIQIPLKEQLNIALETDDLPNKTKEEQLVQSKTNIKPLKIGDTIPEALWNTPLQVVNHPEGKKTITLNDYKGKLIILDFWATWCGGCILAFPKLDTLQMHFKEKLQILLINSKNSRDNSISIKSVLENSQRFNGRKILLTSVFNDILFQKLFVHSMLPHYVWIFQNKVIATTFPEDVNEINIKKALSSERLDIDFKVDVKDYNQNKPLFASGNGSDGENVLYRSQISGKINGLPTQTSVVTDKNKLVTKYTSINASKIDLFKLAYQVLSIPNNRIYINDDTLNVIQTNVSYPYEFCFELISKPITQKEVFEKLQLALIQHFSMGAILENRLLKCFILRRSKSKKIGVNFSLNHLPHLKQTISGSPTIMVNNLNLFLDQTIIDESNYSLPINYIVPKNSSDMEDLLNLLRKQDFELVEGYRMVKVLAIRPNHINGFTSLK